MSSMKSHIDNFISIPLLKEQMRRFCVIAIAGLLAYFLGVLLPLYNMATRPGIEAERMMVMILSMRHPIVMIWMVLAPFCVVMALYPYHFSGRATTAFYTFPVTKRQLYWTNFFAGAALMIVPLLIMCLFLLIPIFRTQHPEYYIDAFGSIHRNWRGNVALPPTIFPNGLEHGQIVNTLWRVTTFFGRNVVGLMFFFAIFSLAASLAGSRLISILLSGVFPFLPVGVLALVYGMATMYVFGIDEMHLNRILGDTLAFTVPVGSWHNIIWGRTSHGFPWGRMSQDFPIWVYTIIYIAIAAVLFALAYLCSRMRKHERTGDSVVFNKFKNTMVFVLSIAGMVAMGAFMLTLFGGRFWWYVGFVLGFALMFIIAQMIAEKAFDIRHKIKLLIPFGGIMIGAYVVLVLIMTVGMRPYINRVPNPARVEAVAVQHHRGWRNVPSGFVSDPEFIERVIEIHNEILANRAYLRRVHNNRRFNNQWGWSRSFPIVYRMDDGSYIRRNYFLTDTFFRRVGAEELLRDPALIMVTYHGLQYPQDVRYLSISFWNNEHTQHFSSIVTEQDEILPLVAAILVEYRDHVARMHVARPIGETVWVDVRIELIPDATGQFMIRTDWVNFNAYVNGEVMRLLREFGHIE